MQLDQISVWIPAITLAVLFVWLTIITVILIQSMKTYRRFTSGISKKDLKSILNRIADDLKKAGGEITHLNQAVDLINSQSKFHLQKIGFLRYNPFRDTGGNQSFCLVLLDDNNDGLVITSLHNRDQTRIYAKSIKNSKGANLQLSKEEQLVVKQAQSNKKVKRK